MTKEIIDFTTRAKTFDNSDLVKCAVHLEKLAYYYSLSAHKYRHATARMEIETLLEKLYLLTGRK